jgi:protein-S-isoprenylcysteine O-methyltransferase Ste14
MKKDIKNNTGDAKNIRKMVFPLFVLAIVLLGLMLFLPAGTLFYWHAWAFLCVLFIPFIFVVFYFLKNDPGLLQRRMKFKEKEVQQKLIIKLANLLFFIGILIPGLDYRYGWSNVPIMLVIFSDIVIFLGYILIFFVFKENSYTSRIVEVDKKQKVVSTGPYSIIRHPMYLGIILMYVFIPLALGSYFAMIFFIPVIILIIFRILNEEKVLTRDLKGYKEYMKKVKYRIVPGVW